MTEKTCLFDNKKECPALKGSQLTKNFILEHACPLCPQRFAIFKELGIKRTIQGNIEFLGSSR